MRKYLYLLTAVGFLLSSCGKSDYQTGLEYQEDGEYPKAVRYYAKSIANQKNVDLSSKNLGDIFFSKDDFDRAFKYYKMSIETNPDLALEKIIGFISYSDQNVRRMAAETISKLENPEARIKAINILGNMLKSDKQYEVTDALDVISYFGNECEPIIGNIVALLDNPNPIIKQKALAVLPAMPESVAKTEALEKVNSILKQQDDQNNEITKAAAVECLGNMGEYAKEYLPILLYVCVENPNLKEQSLSAMGKIGVPTKEQMEQLYPFLKDKPFEIKEIVLNRIGDMRQQAASFVPYIILFLNDPDNEIKQLTRNALTKIGKPSNDTIGEFINLLNTQNREIKLRAVFELGEMGKDASSAIDPLTKLANDRDKEIKEYAERALKQIRQN